VYWLWCGVSGEIILCRSFVSWVEAKV